MTVVVVVVVALALAIAIATVLGAPPRKSDPVENLANLEKFKPTCSPLCFLPFTHQSSLFTCIAFDSPSG
jgi:energy-converting hydrogenase Eha subunit E